MKKCSRAGGKAGFSLVELLAVMGILVILSALLVPRFRAVSPSGATREVMGIFATARERARSMGLPVRVVFCTDPAAGDRYLTSVAILVDNDGSSATQDWRLGERIESLPAGTLFWEQYSNTTNTMKFDFNSKAVQNGNVGSSCVFVEFDGLGETTQGGQQFVFVEGTTSGTPSQAIFQNTKNRDGFVLRRVGALSQFKSPDQIQPPTP